MAPDTFGIGTPQLTREEVAVESLWPYGVSWFYLYGVGGLIYAVGTYFCVRQNVLDFSQPRERQIWLFATACLCAFAAGHALFQFVLPFAGS